MSEEEAIQSAIKICKRWRKKFKKNYSPPYENQKSIEDLFDSFFTLFVSYNALYCAINIRNKQAEDSMNDKKSVTENVPKYLGHSALAEELIANEEIKQGIRQIIDLIEIRFFSIVFKKDDSKKSHYYIADTDEEREHIDKVKKGLNPGYEFIDKSGYEEFTKSLLFLIYKTRCNMFHGRKQIDNNQKKLLIPMNAILIKIIEMGLDKLEQEGYR